MTDTPRASVIKPHSHSEAFDRIELDYEARFLRRKRLTTAGGISFILDLPETVSLDEGNHIVLDDGREVVVVAAPEPLLLVRGHITRLAWHIGNRHTPCQIEADHLLIRDDHVLEQMLQKLGAEVTHVTQPFTPEGGAYGHGRTHSHEH
ncbi:urease accessory protein UreE [Qingshengfaniella alkalisoli]|uniref:Urease accessory protein UreE n=1 Tax=Qingshengfaniella alkalisoli TaxID=2599296 RepID=A0A5B8J3V2_9RHOB|nr:urease accessory protein UreE [Qingshengfaniella alkalisoli]QDY68970.1 urease accessory protein UreE [Qingshengfaniella alkalisoli]